MKTKILTLLRLSGPTGCPETALKLELEMRYRIVVGDMEWSHSLNELKRQGFILESIDELTGDRRWTVNSEKA